MQKLMRLKWIGILALILFLAMFPATLAGQESTPMEFGIYRVNSIEIELKENGIANVREELVVDGPEARILLPQTSRLEISDLGGKLEYRSDIVLDKHIVSFKPCSHFPASDGKVFISYTSNHLTSKTGNIWLLKFSSLATPAHTEVMLEFPPGSTVISITPDVPKYPKNLSNPMLLYPQGDSFSFECNYEAGKAPPSGIDATTLTVIVIVVILVIVLILSISKRRKKDERMETKEQETPSEDETGEQDNPSEVIKGKSSIKESVLNMLDEREREIIGVIEKSGEEEITQAYIYKTTGIPKATLSDIMRKLEGRNILTRTSEGRTKWIKLKNWIFD